MASPNAVQRRPAPSSAAQPSVASRSISDCHGSSPQDHVSYIELRVASGVVSGIDFTNFGRAIALQCFLVFVMKNWEQKFTLLVFSRQIAAE
jgi:hypothetical protein